MSELKPCPFCGAKAHKDNAYVNCSNKDCPVRPVAKYYRNIDHAVRDWNTRANSPDTQALKLVREALTEIVEITNGGNGKVPILSCQALAELNALIGED